MCTFYLSDTILQLSTFKNLAYCTFPTQGIQLAEVTDFCCAMVALRDFAGESLLYLTSHVPSEHEVDYCPCQVAADHHMRGVVER